MGEHGVRSSLMQAQGWEQKKGDKCIILRWR